MANLSVLEEEKPDIIITSPAKRARDTANQFRKAHKLKKEFFIKDPRLYMSSTDTMLDILREMPDNINTVYIFAHNPGMTYTANYFSNDYIENVPTCGMFKVVSSASEWNLISQENCQLEKFTYPKLYTR